MANKYSSSNIITGNTQPTSNAGANKYSSSLIQGTSVFDKVQPEKTSTSQKYTVPTPKYEDRRADYTLTDADKSKLSELEKKLKEIQDKKNKIGKTQYESTLGPKVQTSGPVSYGQKTTPYKPKDNSTEYNNILSQEKNLQGQISKIKNNLTGKENLLGTIGNIGVSAGAGLLNVAEGISDLGQYATSGLLRAGGLDDAADFLKSNAQANSTDLLLQGTRDKLDKQTYAGFRQGEVGSAVPEGVGYVLGMIGSGGLLGSANTVSKIPIVGNILSKIPVIGKVLGAAPTGTFLSATGSGMSEAYEGGATDKEALLYGLGSGTINAGVEGLFGIPFTGKIGKGLKSAFGATSLDESAVKYVTSKIKSNVGKNAAKFGMSVVGENIEEQLSGILDPLLRRLTFDEKAALYTTKDAWDTVIMTTLVTAITQSPAMLQDIRNSAKAQGKTEEQVIEDIVNNIEPPVNNEVLKPAVDEAIKQGPTQSTETPQSSVTDPKVAELETKITDLQSKIDNSKRIGNIEDEMIYTSELDKLTKQRDSIVQTASTEAFKTGKTEQFMASKEYKAMKKISDKLGVNLEVGNIDGAEGSYNIASKTIRLDGNATDLKSVFAHEVAHNLEQSDAYKQLEKYISKIYEQSEIDRIKAEIQSKRDQQKLNEADLQSEFVAHVIQSNMFDNEISINELFKTDKTLFEKLKSIIDDLVIAFKGTKYEPDLKRIQKLYNKAVVEVAKKVEKEVKKELPKKVEVKKVEVKKELPTKVEPKKEIKKVNKPLPETKRVEESKTDVKVDLTEKPVEIKNTNLNDTFEQAKFKYEMLVSTGVKDFKTEALGFYKKYKQDGGKKIIPGLEETVEKLPIKKDTAREDFKKLLMTNIANVNLNLDGDLDKIMKLDNVKFSIVGVNAKLPIGKKSNLIKANEMSKKGINQDTIWAATGWELDTVDNKWKYEIKDGKIIESKKSTVKPGQVYPLRSIYSGKELFKAYPDMKKINVRFVSFVNPDKTVRSNTFGAYNQGTNTILVNDKLLSQPSKIINSLFAHELQHVIQVKEGFATGGSPEYMKDIFDKLNITENYPGEIRELYKQLAGEVESRNVEGRMNMTPDAKMKTRPSLTRDTKQSDIIVPSKLEKIISDNKTVKYSKQLEDEGLKIPKRKRDSKNITNKVISDLGISTLDFRDAKNLTTLGLNREEPIRLNERVFSKKVAGYLNEKVFHPIREHNANMVRWETSERKSLKELNIKPKTKESAAVQKLGEGQYINDKKEMVKYTLEDVKKEFPKDWEKIQTAERVLRQKYDNYLEITNEKLEEYGYEPIPKRKDYFLHFQQLNDVFTNFGFPGPVADSKTDGENRSYFRPGKAFFSSELQRKTPVTEYDAIQGIDRYITQAGELIFHTEDIQNLRALQSFIKEQYIDAEIKKTVDGKETKQNHLQTYYNWLSDYTDIQAGKKHHFDQSIERVFGKGMYDTVSKLKSHVGAMLTGMNVGSSLSNFITVTQGLAKTNKVAFVKGTYDTLSSLFVNDGLMEKSDFYTNRKGSKHLTKPGSNWFTKGYAGAKDFGQLFMSATDKLSAQMIIRSKYHEMLSKGYSKDVAMKKADRFASRLMAGRTKAEMPVMFDSKIIGIFTQFQLEVNNQIGVIFNDTFSENYAANSKKSLNGGTIKNTKLYNTAMGLEKLMELFAFAFLFNEGFEELTGRRPAFDPYGIYKDAMKHYTNDNLDNTEATIKVTKDILGQFPFTDLLVGGGRIPITGVLPDAGKLMSGDTTIEKELTKLPYLALPTGGSQLRKIQEGASLYKNKENPGEYVKTKDKTLKLKFPVKKDEVSKTKNIIFGKYSSKEAQDYFDNNWQPLSENQTKYFQAGTLPIKDFRNYVKKINSFESDKDYRDEPISGTATMKKYRYIDKLPISEEKKRELFRYVDKE